MQPEDEWSKLYKKLGSNHNNKDIRLRQQDFLDEFLENRLSPTLQQSFNPNYRLDNRMDTTEFRRQYSGRKEEPTDKVYFRKADELCRYAESMFKNRALMAELEAMFREKQKKDEAKAKQAANK